MRYLIVFFALGLTLFAACKKEEPQPIDEVAQLEIDLEKIDNYIVEHGLVDDTLHHPTKIRYIILQEGSGLKPRYDEDSIEVAYVGTLLDTGEQFDANDAFRTRLDQNLILGWQIMLQEMREGDRYQIFLPSFFGYADEGSPPKIPANAVLIFDIELKRVYK